MDHRAYGDMPNHFNSIPAMKSFRVQPIYLIWSALFNSDYYLTHIGQRWCCCSQLVPAFHSPFQPTNPMKVATTVPFKIPDLANLRLRRSRGFATTPKCLITKIPFSQSFKTQKTWRSTQKSRQKEVFRTWRTTTKEENKLLPEGHPIVPIVPWRSIIWRSRSESEV